MVRPFRMITAVAFLVLAIVVSGCQTQGSGEVPSSLGAPSVTPVAYAPQQPVARAKSVLVVDAMTGRELYAVDADAPRYPASLTKLMTL